MLGVLGPGAGQDRHGDLGQIVEHQIVDLAPGDELRRGAQTVAPEAGGTADADHLRAHDAGSSAGLAGARETSTSRMAT